MKILPKTRVLLAVGLLLTFANVWEGESPIQSDLPTLSGVSKDSFQRIELTQSGQKILFEKEQDVWFIKSPVEAKADQARIKSLLLNFRKGISMDVMVEKGNEEEYGLDASHSIVVELWSDSSEPSLSFTLGNDSARGSSFVRLSGDDAVYRARMGGRHRYEYSVSDWKNRLLFDFKESELQSLAIESPQVSYTLNWSGELWEIKPKPNWQLNQGQTRSMLARIGATRIGSTWKEPLERSDVQFQMSFRDGTEKKARIQLSDVALIEIGQERYRASVSIFKKLASDPSFFRDKQLYRFNPRSDLDTITYETEGQRMVFQQDLSNGFWRVLEPIGMDIDMKQVFFMVNSLASAQAISFVSEPLLTPRIQLSFQMLDGTQEQLDIGEEQNGMYLARRGTETFLISKELVQKIQQAFGKTF
ncbi:MAG: DUF4340 domain-containing protein [Myxococcota bacterium]|nr:DUF4340 domain-containing protein [Myxococcota bacterium]